MSSDKMREEFEHWECDSDEGPQTDPMWMDYSDEHNAFRILAVQANWIVWQASRAAVVVELPKPGEYANALGDYAKGSRQARRDAVDAIEAAGLKVR